MAPHYLLAALVAFSVLLPTHARASEEDSLGALPLWEFGLWAGVGRLPHYRGSDEYKDYILPLPFIIYRDKIFRANRDGLNSVFWENSRLETGFSFGGNPPVTDDNETRSGMPDLGAIGEFGPQIKYFIFEKGSLNSLYLSLAVRIAISLDIDDFDLGHEGFRGGTRLIYQNRTLGKNLGLTFGVNAGLTFASSGYTRYFYEVAPEYATDERPAYTPHGGYSGFDISANATKKLTERLSLGIYYRWDNINDTSYVDSPLVQTKNNHIVGCALIWNIYQSKTMSPHRAE